MSYCVNCGVELEKSLSACPLCGVEVQNPREPHDADAPRPFNSRVARIQRRVERRFAAIIVSVILLLIIAVCMMADLVYGSAERITWSAYVAGGLGLLWLLILFPLCFPQVHPVVYVLLDVCGVLLFLYVVNSMDATADWYIALAAPQVLLYGFLGLLNVLAWRSPRVVGLERVSCVAGAIGAGMMGLEIMLDLYNNVAVSLDWSWFVSIPMAMLALLMVIVERKRAFKDELFRRLRV